LQARRDGALKEVMSTSGAESEHDEGVDELQFVDAATRVARPSAFDRWYYGIEDKIGQGTVGMGVCLILFIVILLVAIFFNPI
jgi:hypothetical protein